VPVAAATPDAPAATTLLHRDFHAWNTLWVGDRLTGIVDWTTGSQGPFGNRLTNLFRRFDVTAGL